MKKLAFALFASLLVIQIPLNAQQKRVLAEVGSEEITASEFAKRFQLTPQIQNKKITSKKEEMLYALISEKLWAQRAEELGLDSSDLMEYTFKALEEMYIRDALYQRAIKQKVEVDPDVFQTALERSKYTLNLEMLVSGTNKQIKQVYDELQSGNSFSKVAEEYYPRGVLRDTMEISYGVMQDSIENYLYDLKEGEITEPVKAQKGWVIFKLLNKEEQQFKTGKEYKKYQREVKKKVEEQATRKVFDKYTKSFFAGNKVNTNGYIFWSFADKMIESVHAKKDSLNLPENEKIVLEAKDFKNIEKKLGQDTLQMTFIEFENDPVSTKEFIREFAFEGFYTKAMKPGIIRGQLKSRVKRFIERELLVREAYEKGLNELPEVQASIDMWRDSYLAKMMKNRFYDSAEVSDQEAREYFDNRDENEGFVKKVNIVEILVDSLEMVEEIFRRLDEGADFRELAVRFTQREWTIKNEGEFGFFPVTEYGEIGRTAADMEVGEIFGPLEVPEGYSIFKLIDVKKEAEKLPDSFEKAKSKIKEKLKMQKVKDIMVDETIRLADKYGVSVDKNLLNSISVKNYNMLVYRYMGFGGRITAVPQTIPFTEWIKYWDKSDKVLP